LWENRPLGHAGVLIRECLAAIAEEAGYLIVVSDATGLLLSVEGSPRIRMRAAQDMKLRRGHALERAGGGDQRDRHRARGGSHGPGLRARALQRGGPGRGARALFGMLSNDEAHGEENRATMQGWLSRWTATSVAAAHQLQPIWSRLPEKVVRFEDSFERSRQRFTGLLGDLSLDTPKELSA
jgi:hypothetical protein